MNLSILKELSGTAGTSSDTNEDDFYQTSKYDFECINEIRVSNLIKNDLIMENLPFYVVTSHEFIVIKDLNHHVILTPIKYVLLRYNLDILNYQSFSNYLATVEYPSGFLSIMLETYFKLLNSLLDLEKINICFFSLSAEQILMNTQSSNAILANFKRSLVLEDPDDRHFIQILENTTCYTYKPIEIHLIHYLLTVNGAPLSYSSIDEITSRFTKNMDFFNHFEEEYKTQYYNECVGHLRTKYLNKSKDYIITEVKRENWKTWDNFSISILFLHIFKHMANVFSLNNTIINELVQFLKQNLDAVPTKRNTLSYTIAKVNELLLKNQDWGFLRLIRKSKMKKLYERIVA